jgi:hypothetical protein
MACLDIFQRSLAHSVDGHDKIKKPKKLYCTYIIIVNNIIVNNFVCL